MSFTFTWHWDETQLAGYVGRLAITADTAAHEAALDVEMLAKQYAPVDTGSLQDTIDLEPVGQANYAVNAGDTAGGYKGGGKTGKASGTPVDYAVHQEYNGTPYMTPAAEEAWQAFINDFSAKLGALI